MPRTYLPTGSPEATATLRKAGIKLTQVTRCHSETGKARTLWAVEGTEHRVRAVLVPGKQWVRITLAPATGPVDGILRAKRP